MKPALFVIAAIFVLMAVLSPSASPLLAGTDLIDEVARGTGLLVYNKGESSCTGWVARSTLREGNIRYDYPVWESLVATAWHCTRSGNDFRFGLDSRAEFAGIVATSAEWDVALLAFRGKKKLAALKIGNEPSIGDKVLLYGYGFRVPLPKVGNVVGWDDGLFSVNNVASPGNSGGPVVSFDTGLVVGIGLKNTIRIPPGNTPMYCVIVRCPVISPYWAVPANKLLGLVRWTP